MNNRKTHGGKKVLICLFKKKKTSQTVDKSKLLKLGLKIVFFTFVLKVFLPMLNNYINKGVC